MNVDDLKQQLEKHAPATDRGVMFLDWGTILAVPRPFMPFIYEMIQKGEVKIILPMPPDVH